MGNRVMSEIVRFGGNSSRCSERQAKDARKRRHIFNGAAVGWALAQQYAHRWAKAQPTVKSERQAEDDRSDVIFLKGQP